MDRFDTEFCWSVEDFRLIENSVYHFGQGLGADPRVWKKTKGRPVRPFFVRRRAVARPVFWWLPAGGWRLEAGGRRLNAEGRRPTARVNPLTRRPH
ncbi:hypothetical protein THIOKS11660029 [Thiocapsa sp. KS1]|nr:hypothetical protein THIOKS11660029 [Thiocapsa sp. KS1]